MVVFTYSIENHYPDANAFMQAYPFLREKLAPDNYLTTMPIGITGFVSSWLHYYLNNDPSAPPKKILEAMADDVLDFNVIAQFLTAVQRSDPNYLSEVFNHAEMAMSPREAMVCATELLRRYAHGTENWDNISAFVDHEEGQSNLRTMLTKMLEIHPELDRELAFPTDELSGKIKDILVHLRRKGMHMPPDEADLQNLYMERRMPLLNRVNEARSNIIGRPLTPELRSYLDGKALTQNAPGLNR